MLSLGRVEEWQALACKQAGQVIFEEVADALDRNVRQWIRGEYRRIVREFALPREHRRHTLAPGFFHRGQNTHLNTNSCKPERDKELSLLGQACSRAALFEACACLRSTILQVTHCPVRAHGLLVFA